MIENLSDLCAHFYADEPRGLNRRIYKDTACGASISILMRREDWEKVCDRAPPQATFGRPRRMLPMREWAVYNAPWLGRGASVYVHNGDRVWEWVREDDPILGFTIQTIVEGSDATVDSDLFTLPVEEEKVDAWIEEMEVEADALWREANEDDEEDEVQGRSER